MSLAVLSDSASDSSESANCGGDSGGGGGCDSELLCQPVSAGDCSRPEKRMQLSHLTVQWHENKSSCGVFRKQMWMSIKSIKNPLDDLYGLPLYLYDCM